MSQHDLFVKQFLMNMGYPGIHSMGHSLGSSSSDGPSSIKDPCRMVKTFQAYLPECCHRTYSCVHCRAHLANHDELISKVISVHPLYNIF